MISTKWVIKPIWLIALMLIFVTILMALVVLGTTFYSNSSAINGMMRFAIFLNSLKGLTQNFLWFMTILGGVKLLLLLTKNQKRLSLLRK